MLTTTSLRLIARHVTRVSRPTVAVRCMSGDAHGYHDDHGKSAVQIARDHRATLNDLPVPSGSWQEHHNKRNTSYNLLLAAGVISLVATFILMKQSGSLYLHSAPNLKKVEINPK